MPIARPLGATSENVRAPVTCTHLAAGAASKVGQTAKARSGYRVQSLHKGRDRQCRTYLIDCRPTRVVKSARFIDGTDVDQVVKIAQEAMGKRETRKGRDHRSSIALE